MNTTIAKVQGTDLAAAVESARSYASDAMAGRTKAAYRSDWRTFTAWCGSLGLEALPASPSTVAAYLSARADQGRKVATIGRALAAISQAHKVAGLDSPRSSAPVQLTMQGIRRRLGVAQRQVAPILPADLRRMIEALPASTIGTRDRAILCIGFAGAFRRSELAGLDLADLHFGADGLTINLRRSKTDQDGAGRKVGIPYGGTPATCPVRAVQAWKAAAGIESGPLFRQVDRHGNIGAGRTTGKTVARVVKRSAELVGLDPSQVSGHSLRAGLATAAAKAGKSERAIMRQTGHRSVAMVRRYVRDADLFSDNAAAGIGL
jgi:integrase